MHTPKFGGDEMTEGAIVVYNFRFMTGVPPPPWPGPTGSQDALAVETDCSSNMDWLLDLYCI